MLPFAVLLNPVWLAACWGPTRMGAAIFVTASIDMKSAHVGPGHESQSPGLDD